MKKLFYWALIIPFLLNSCGNSAEVERLQAERDSLEQIANSKEETIGDFVKSLNEIEANLELIKQKEKIITVQAHGDVELDANSKDKINDDILSIYELMQKNKRTISKLQRQLKRSNIKSSEFKKMIKSLNDKIQSKDAQIEEMKNSLAKLNIDVQELNKEIANLNTNIDTLQNKADVQEEVIDQQDKKLHQAYYVFGNKKELKKHKIISSTGGFVGLGRIQKLTENFNKDYFKKVDIREFKSVPLFAKKAELVTSHPASSYYFAGNDKVDSLVIKNPDEFWSVSKYLVIMVN